MALIKKGRGGGYSDDDDDDGTDDKKVESYLYCYLWA
jgi:hypothetical protein